MKKRFASPPAGSRLTPRRGFTLLEVLLAVAIFSICMAAIYAGMRSSTRAFESGRRSAEVMQTLRFTINLITRDLRSVYYETDYNQRYERLAHTMRQLQFYANQVFADDRDDQGDRDDPKSRIVGSKNNLQFIGEDDGEADTLEFSHFLPSDGTFDNSFMGAERVRYYLSGTDLLRRRSRVVTLMQKNPNLEEELEMIQEKADAGDTDISRRRALQSRYGGSRLPAFLDPLKNVEYFIEIEKESIPPEILAENVVSFELKYGYFFAEWKESDAWDSQAKKYRTPLFNLEEIDVGFLNKALAFEMRDPDHLPSYVRVLLKISDAASRRGGEKKSKVHAIESVVWLPAAIETFVPTDESYFEPQQEATVPKYSPPSTGRRETRY